MSVNNIIDIKKQNIFRILNLVRRNNGILKKDIGEKLHISNGTVSNLCSELKAVELISEIESDEEDFTVGRQPKYVCIRKRRYYTLCFDTHRCDDMRLVLVDICGDILGEEPFQPESVISLERFAESALDTARICCARFGVDMDDVIGVGVAVPAVFDTKTEHTVCSGISLFEDVPLKSILEEKFLRPVFIDNESNLCAYHTHSEHPMQNDLVYLFCSEGLGAGVVVAGNMLTGARGYASEICHIPIGRLDYVCELCSGKGCVQTDLSISGFISKYEGRQIASGNSNIKSLWQDFVEKARSGDPRATAVIKENGEILGKLVSVLVNLFDPDSFYIGGDVSVLLDTMMPTVEAEVALRRIGKGRAIPNIFIDKDPETIVLGCAEQVFRSTVSVQELRKHQRTLQRKAVN